MIAQRLALLRQKMNEAGVDAYVITSADAHQSEYVSDHWKSREWITGFDGSAGVCVITKDKAGLWTDGRYFIQAEQQLKGTAIDLHKMHMDGVLTFYEWLTKNLHKGATVGFDGRCVSVALFKKIDKEFKKNAITCSFHLDLIQDIWSDRPAMPQAPAFEHDIAFAGKSRAEKLAEVRKKMTEKGAVGYILSSLDDIAWLLNIRGDDVLCTPVVYAHVFITADNAYLFIDMEKLDEALTQKITADGYTLKPYDQIVPFLSTLTLQGQIILNPDKVSILLKEAFPQTPDAFVEETDITTQIKAVKNAVELANIEKTQQKDGAAVVKFIKWIKDAVKTQTLEEADVHDKLVAFRQEQEHFKGASFITIAGYQENAASMHYTPVKGKSKTLKAADMLLIDNGGQYLGGTTDITRTIALGSLSPEMKKDFTIVLKSHIALATALFLKGTSGENLDILARIPMWEAGMDYKCGTGHGIGYFLSVHEGPQGFGMTCPHIPLEPGMIITNEPGIYKAGQWGIRTENTLKVVEHSTTESGKFMCFETISYAPIDLEAIDPQLLTDSELEWLNQYHKTVYEKLAPYLNSEEQAWLMENTQKTTR